jgi:hypothetical protein
MTKRYFYNIGCHSPEGGQELQMTHTKKFTNEELRKEMEEALWAALMSEECKPKKHKGKYGGQMGPTFEDLVMSAAFANALVRRGFIRVNYAAGCLVLAWARALDPMDWSKSGYKSKEDVETSKRLRARWDEMLKKEKLECKKTNVKSKSARTK